MQLGKCLAVPSFWIAFRDAIPGNTNTAYHPVVEKSWGRERRLKNKLKTYCWHVQDHQISSCEICHLLRDGFFSQRFRSHTQEHASGTHSCVGFMSGPWDSSVGVSFWPFSLPSLCLVRSWIRRSYMASSISARLHIWTTWRLLCCCWYREDIIRAVIINNNIINLIKSAPFSWVNDCSKALYNILPQSSDCQNQARTRTILESMLQHKECAQIVFRFLTGPHLYLGGVRQSRIKCLVKGHTLVGLNLDHYKTGALSLGYHILSSCISVAFD